MFEIFYLGLHCALRNRKSLDAHLELAIAFSRPSPKSFNNDISTSSETSSLDMLLEDKRHGT